jgi:hypothetical protein
MLRQPPFGAAFNAAEALQLIISAAFRSGTSVSLDQTVDTILANFPDCGMSRRTLDCCPGRRRASGSGDANRRVLFTLRFSEMGHSL